MTNTTRRTRHVTAPAKTGPTRGTAHPAAYLALALAVLTLAGCAPNAGTPGPAPAPTPITIVPQDAALELAARWGAAWWSEAFPGAALEVAPAGAPCTGACVPLAWLAIPVVPGAAHRIGWTCEEPDGAVSVAVDPSVASRPEGWLRAVVAHELGHVMGLRHAPKDDTEDLMAPAPDIPGGTLCITGAAGAVCRDLAGGAAQSVQGSAP